LLASALGLGASGASGQDAVLGADPEGHGLHRSAAGLAPAAGLDAPVPRIPKVHESLMAVFGRVQGQPLRDFGTLRASGMPQTRLPSCTLSGALSDCQEPRLYSAPRRAAD